MTTELATTNNALAAVLSDPERLKDIPIDTVERLFELDRRMKADAAREGFHEAFALVQGELQPVAKRAKNTHTMSMYALAEDIERMAMPILTRHGFSKSISAIDSPKEEHYRVVLTLRRAGHEETHYMDAPNDSVGVKGNPTKTRLHGMASSHTFSGRHLFCNVLGVILTKDDDGNAGAGVGPSAETITESQAADLDLLIENVSADKAKFLGFFRIGKVGELPASRHREAVRMLEAKRAQA